MKRGRNRVILVSEICEVVSPPYTSSVCVCVLEWNSEVSCKQS